MQTIPGAVCAAHAGQSAVGTCPRCGSFVCEQCLAEGHGMTCEHCRELEGATGPSLWERRHEVGFFQAFLETWKTSMFKPESFWRTVPAQGPLFDAMLFGWISSAIAAVPNFLLFFAQAGTQLEQIQSTLASNPDIARFIGGLSPLVISLLVAVVPAVLYPIGFFISAGLVHLGCLMWGAGSRGFNTTARVVGYSQAPLLLSWIPCVGGAAGLYVLVLEILGIMRLHKTSGGRATGGVLTIPLLILVCACGAGIFAAVAMASAIGSK